ncbi:uncharacterized protein METZ01_LOCUS461114, partial [marine metagenome]
MKRLFFSFALMGGVLICAAESPQVFPKGKLPDDSRLKPLKDLNGHFPFKVPATLGQWEKRKAELQLRVQVATGLFPMPARTPLNAVIHGKVKRDGFTAEKIYFESVPGFYVTGILFRPEETKGKIPAILCPHGHGGRLQMHSESKVLDEIKIG